MNAPTPSIPAIIDICAFMEPVSVNNEIIVELKKIRLRFILNSESLSNWEFLK